jgi:hypothetical protein
MIALGNATTTLTATLSGAKNTNDAPVTVFFVDEPSAPTGVAVAVNDKYQSTTNGVTPVTICTAGPGGVGMRRRVKSINVFNADLAAITIAIKIVDTANSTTTLQQVTLQTLEQLNYEEGFGFQAIDAGGAVKSQAAQTSSATSTALETASQASSMASIALVGSSQASSLAAAIVPASVNSVSSQASSLAAGIVVASVNSVSSQASSMAALVPASVSSNASLGVLGSTQASSLLARWSVTISKTSSSFSF